MFEELAEDLLQEVRGRIGGAGKVQRWQEKYVGSGGGYAAVRPKARTYDERGNAVGYVTNAINSGHAVRKPGGQAKRYRSQVKQSYVPGKGFYEAARGQTESIVRAAMERFEARIQEALT